MRLPCVRHARAPRAARLAAWPCAALAPRNRRALFHLLACETSCYRYWGQGTWTGYGAELARRACTALYSTFMAVRMTMVLSFIGLPSAGKD